MGIVDLTTLTDKQLIELEKRISKEKEARKDSLMYKSNISITENRYNAETKLINNHIRELGSDYDVDKTIRNPVYKIHSDVLNICDYIFGNFKVVTNTKLDYSTIKCEGSRLLIDNKEDYKKFHDEIYSVIDKWVETLLQ